MTLFGMKLTTCAAMPGGTALICSDKDLKAIAHSVTTGEPLPEIHPVLVVDIPARDYDVVRPLHPRDPTKRERREFEKDRE